jgi:hypothetical protein
VAGLAGNLTEVKTQRAADVVNGSRRPACHSCLGNKAFGLKGGFWRCRVRVSAYRRPLCPSRTCPYRKPKTADRPPRIG